MRGREVRLIAVLLVFGASSALSQFPGGGAPATGKQKNDASGKSRTGTVDRSNSATGGDGCYFGECPDGSVTERKAPNPPPKEKVREPTEKEDGTDSPKRDRRTTGSQQLTAICQTPAFWCRMNVTGRPGLPCYCNIPGVGGPLNGVTVGEP